MDWQKAISEATKWARANQYKSVFAAAALGCIEALDESRWMGKAQGISEGDADVIQLNYVIANLGPWRGETAREAKVAIKARIKALQKSKNPLHIESVKGKPLNTLAKTGKLTLIKGTSSDGCRRQLWAHDKVTSRWGRILCQSCQAKAPPGKGAHLYYSTGELDPWIIQELGDRTLQCGDTLYNNTLITNPQPQVKGKWAAINSSAIVNNIKLVFKAWDIRKLNGPTYRFIINHMGFIAHYSNAGFQDSYRDLNEFARTLMTSEYSRDPQYNAKWADRFGSTDPSYSSMYSRAYVESVATAIRGILAVASQYTTKQMLNPRAQLKGQRRIKSRKLTNAELRKWGENISNGEDWEGVNVDMVYRMMQSTAGNAYDTGEAEWDFDKSDAKRLLSLMRPLLNPSGWEKYRDYPYKGILGVDKVYTAYRKLVFGKYIYKLTDTGKPPGKNDGGYPFLDAALKQKGFK